MFADSSKTDRVARRRRPHSPLPPTVRAGYELMRWLVRKILAISHSSKFVRELILRMPGTMTRRLLTPLLSYQLRRSLGRLNVSMPLSSRPAEPTMSAHEIAIYRRAGQVQFGLSTRPADMVFKQRPSITAYLYLFSHCPPEVEAITCACDDGNLPSAARFAPSSRTTSTIAVPDRYFILRNGFAAERRLAEANSIPWSDRRSTLVWRGGLNGDGIHPQMPEDADNPRVIQRLRLCMKLKSVPGVDVRISSAIDPSIPRSQLEPFGILGADRAEAEWLGDKFAIDIDGWTNAWSNLIIRLHFGCCVLKVASADGYRQWWYDRLVPWEHYVPVSADMGDLVEKIDWVRSHDNEAQAIARRGRALVQTMTLASETAIGAALITNNWIRS